VRLYSGQEGETQYSGPNDFSETLVPNYQAIRRHAVNTVSLRSQVAQICQSSGSYLLSSGVVQAPCH
jgi:hypothetical protein